MLRKINAESAGPMETLEQTVGGMSRVSVVLVNAYMVGEPGGPWTLVDAGLPNAAGYLRWAAAQRYGPDARPEAIVLTHGHFDHAGSALELAEYWNVPVYAHRLEMPYLTGRSDYPPQDPTVGGAMAFLERFFPNHGYDLGNRVRELPADGSVPTMPGWRWLHTPGHTPGHVSLFRESDRTLIAGDAVTTTNLDSWTAQATWEPELCRPVTPFTPDWLAARRSVQRLAELEPNIIVAGHGRPMSGPNAADELRHLAGQDFTPPVGRYVGHPPLTDEDGALVAVPPPAPDLMPKRLTTMALTAAAAVAFLSFIRSGRR